MNLGQAPTYSDHMMSSHLRTTTDGAAAVNPGVFWQEITPENQPPRGAKLLLINQASGVALIGHYRTGDWYTHFAGLPVFKERT